MNAIMNLSPNGKMKLVTKRCFWCDKPIGTLAVKIEDGKDIPSSVVKDYEPCDDCAKKMEDGVTLVAVATIPLRPGQPPLPKRHMDGQPDDVYPIGKWAVIDTSEAKRYFKDRPDDLDMMLQSGFCCVSDEMFDKMVPKSARKQDAK